MAKVPSRHNMSFFRHVFDNESSTLLKNDRPELLEENSSSKDDEESLPSSKQSLTILSPHLLFRNNLFSNGLDEPDVDDVDGKGESFLLLFLLLRGDINPDIIFRMTQSCCCCSFLLLLLEDTTGDDENDERYCFLLLVLGVNPSSRPSLGSSSSSSSSSRNGSGSASCCS